MRSVCEQEVLGSGDGRSKCDRNVDNSRLQQESFVDNGNAQNERENSGGTMDFLILFGSMCPMSAAGRSGSGHMKFRGPQGRSPVSCAPTGCF